MGVFLLVLTGLSEPSPELGRYSFVQVCVPKWVHYCVSLMGPERCNHLPDGHNNNSFNTYESQVINYERHMRGK